MWEGKYYVSEKTASKRYSHEINKINNKLNQLEIDRVYEISKAKMDGYLSTNIKELKELFEDLLFKIDNDLPSTNEVIGSTIKNIKI